MEHDRIQPVGPTVTLSREEFSKFKSVAGELWTCHDFMRKACEVIVDGVEVTEELRQEFLHFRRDFL